MLKYKALGKHIRKPKREVVKQIIYLLTTTAATIDLVVIVLKYLGIIRKGLLNRLHSNLNRRKSIRATCIYMH
ncbi:MAG: hypothetical protein N4A59_00080 [Marinifilum sp.]|nr:hypothetical protein [Marinifilum sp.]